MRTELELATGDGATCVLRGVTINEWYVTRREQDELAARQEPLGRTGSTRATLIPIKKSEAWWELAQDERWRIFKESSRHVASGLEYLPAVAPCLHHGRDLAESFDFLTWFEFAPKDAVRSEVLVRRLGSTEECGYVKRGRPSPGTRLGTRVLFGRVLTASAAVRAHTLCSPSMSCRVQTGSS